MAWTNPQFLVETDWLAVHLDDPTLRVLECTTILHPRPEGGYRAESGRAGGRAHPTQRVRRPHRRSLGSRILFALHDAARRADGGGDGAARSGRGDAGRAVRPRGTW